jgi:hypothetical protein
VSLTRHQSAQIRKIRADPLVMGRGKRVGVPTNARQRRNWHALRLQEAIDAAQEAAMAAERNYYQVSVAAGWQPSWGEWLAGRRSLPKAKL